MLYLGVIVWAFLLIRPLLSVLHRAFAVLHQHEDTDLIPLSAHLRKELTTARRILPWVFGDVGRTFLPIVIAQDAEGESGGGLGGWGLGFSFPKNDEIVAIGLESMANGVPLERDLGRGEIGWGCWKLSDLRHQHPR